MDLDFSAEEIGFRQGVREFAAQCVPADVRHKVVNGLSLERDDYVRWQRILHAKGWGGPSWPKDFGGPGWTAIQQYIFEEECAAAGAPRGIPFDLKMVAPVIMAFGQQAVQLHGGMGVTDELDVSHYFKRLMAIELQFGSTDHHLELFADQLA
jgi:alkylation response protein AidB-like acyl-CoA dehydrogenase